MQTTLYKDGCDPYVVHSAEELEYHTNQGWTKEKGTVKTAIAPAVLALSQGADAAILKNRVVELEGQLEKASKGGDVEKIRELNDIIKAKDQQILDMQSDFEEITSQMSTTIQELKDQQAAAKPGKK